ncbi:MAG: ABC transporter substrate-binding protein [Oscillospiraceae bacterium]|nr:ABC transporter substrate-binding protein [Oscillospiraceae bacterium]
MKRKIITLLLAIVLTTIFITACGNGDADGEVVDLVLAMGTFVIPGDVQVIEDALNEILTPRYGINLELIVMDVASYAQNATLMLTAGEQIDVMSSLFVGYMTMHQQGFLMDLEENDLLQNYGAGIVEALGGWEIVDGARVAGTLYGLPTNVDHAAGRGAFAVGSQYLEAIGFPLPEPNNDIIHISIEEFEDILAELHVAFPDIETIRPLMPDNIGHYFSIDFLGAQPFGVLLDPANDLTVSDFFTSQIFYDFITMTRRWNQLGFIGGDAAVDDTPVTALTAAGSIMSYFTAGKPGIVVQESGLCAQPMTIFQTGIDFMASNAAARFPWVIPWTTENPEMAMTLMRALYTDPEISNILIWGVEGVHYEVQPSGHIDFAPGLDGSNSGWFVNMAWAMPNQFISHVWIGDDLDLADQLIEFNDNAVQSLAFGFLFDPAPVQHEIVAVTSVFEELLPGIGLGFIDPAEGIAELESRMNAAGLQTIIAEKQRQLDAWAIEAGIG